MEGLAENHVTVIVGNELSSMTRVFLYRSVVSYITIGPDFRAQKDPVLKLRRISDPRARVGLVACLARLASNLGSCVENLNGQRC